MDKRTAAQVLISQHEGFRAKPYRCTSGKLTIGIGRNLDDSGITLDEARALLDNDITRCEQELSAVLDFWSELSTVRQVALIDLCFNLGLSRLLSFRRMLAALRAGDGALAAAELRNSLYAAQVGQRSVTLAEMLSSGVYPWGAEKNVVL